MQVALLVLTGHTLKSIQMLGHPPVMFSLSPSLKLQIQETKIRAGIILELLFVPTPHTFLFSKWPSDRTGCPR